jgi:hypothetical protein
MDNATRRQILERVKQLGYPNTLEALQNPQVLDQYEQQLQAQSQQQQQQPIQQPQPVTFPTPPATTPNYKVPQPRQSEAKPLVMSFNETAPQLMRSGGVKQPCPTGYIWSDEQNRCIPMLSVSGYIPPNYDPNTPINKSLEEINNKGWDTNQLMMEALGYLNPSISRSLSAAGAISDVVNKNPIGYVGNTLQLIPTPVTKGIGTTMSIVSATPVGRELNRMLMDKYQHPIDYETPKQSLDRFAIPESTKQPVFVPKNTKKKFEDVGPKNPPKKQTRNLYDKDLLMEGLKPNLATQDNTYRFNPRIEEAKKINPDEYQMGGKKFDKGGPTDPNSNPDQILTYKDNADWFDNRAIYSGDDRYDAQIRKLVYEGKGGYNPYTKTLHFLKPEQQIKVDETTKAYSKDKRTQTAEDKKLIASDAGKAHILNTAEDFVQKSALATAALASPLLIPAATGVGTTIMGALEAPLVIGGTTVPGVTLGGTIGAAFGGMGINEFGNPNEETNISIGKAIDNPTYENIKDASINSAISGTNFIGLGMLNEAKPAIKSAAEILNKAKENTFIKALNPKAINQIRAQEQEVYKKIVESGKEYNNHIWDNVEPIEFKETNLKNKLLDKFFQGNTARMLLKKRNRYTTLLDKIEGYSLEGDKIVGQVAEFDNVLKSGESQIIDFKTGQPINVSIELPKTKKVIGLEGDNIVKNSESTATAINSEYTNTVKSNIQHIEETIPGTKVFGSSTGVGEVNLPHLSHDYDVFISQSNYNKHVKNKFPFIGPTGPARTHSIGDFGEQGNIDFNIIEEGKDGKAVGDRAIEIFRQFFPDEFYKAEKEAITSITVSGDLKPIKIPYTPDELIAKVDPRIKTIIDSYESSKPKHINRIDAYLHFGDPEIVIKAQEQFVKSLVGSKGKVGPQYADNLLSDYNTNLKILNEIEFIGDPTNVAKNPKKMQAALNDYYINKTILNRSIYPNTDLIGSQKNIESALKEWKPEFGGGSVNGWGLNHVQLGDSRHVSVGNAIISFKQLGLKHYNTPLENIAQIKRQTEEFVLEPTDIEVIKRIIKSKFGEESNAYAYTNNLITSKDLLDFPVENVTEQKKIQEAYNEITKELGIKAATNRNKYGNSKYISTIGNFDEETDALSYASRLKMPADLKSRILRSENFKYIQKQLGNVNVTSKKGFKQLEGYLKVGQETISNKLQTVTKEIEAAEMEIKSLASKMHNKKYGEILKDLHRKTDSIVIKHQKAIDEQNRLLKTAAMIEDIQKIYFIGGVGATAGGLINLGLKKINEKRAEDQKQVEKMSNVELQKLTEDRQKREQLREKKYGGKKFVKGGPKDKGWQEFKTPAGQSIYLDPNFKSYARYLDSKGNVIPNTELQKFSMIYNPQTNTWDSTHSEKALNVYDRRMSFEDRLNKSLGDPMGKAARKAEEGIEPGEDPVDNFRHPLAGMYTQQAIAKKTGNIPVISPTLGWLGANAMGVGHELGTIFNDNRPLKYKGREALEDIFNNAYGATIGLLPIPNKSKEEILYKTSAKNMLPDGISDPDGRDFYFKKMGGKKCYTCNSSKLKVLYNKANYKK